MNRSRPGPTRRIKTRRKNHAGSEESVYTLVLLHVNKAVITDPSILLTSHILDTRVRMHILFNVYGSVCIPIYFCFLFLFLRFSSQKTSLSTYLSVYIFILLLCLITTKITTKTKTK